MSKVKKKQKEAPFRDLKIGAWFMYGCAPYLKVSARRARPMWTIGGKISVSPSLVVELPKRMICTGQSGSRLDVSW